MGSFGLYAACAGGYHKAFMGITPTIEFASLGMWDSLILMVMALVVFGPRRLPEIGRQIGKLMYEFRKASNDFKYQMEEELRVSEEADRRKKEENRVLTDPAKLADNYQAALAAESQSSDAPQLPATAGENASPYPGEECYPEIATADAPAVAEESDEKQILRGAQDDISLEIKAPPALENAEAPTASTTIRAEGSVTQDAKASTAPAPEQAVQHG